MRGAAFVWACLVCACSTPDLTYQAGADGAADDATLGDSSSGQHDGAVNGGDGGGGGGDTGGGDATEPPKDAGSDAPVDAPPDAAWNTCPTPPAGYKCCGGALNNIGCLGPCDDMKCKQCADAGCAPGLVCCTQGGPNDSKCIAYGAACP
jgi:hypothetical protein